MHDEDVLGWLLVIVFLIAVGSSSNVRATDRSVIQPTATTELRPKDQDERYSEPTLSVREVRADQIIATGNCNHVEISGNNYGYINLNCGVQTDGREGSFVSFPPPYEEDSEFVSLAITILPANKQWKINSQDYIGDSISNYYQPVGILEETLRKESWASIPLASATDIVVVGLASQEVPIGLSQQDGIRHEETRARQRVGTLYQSVYNSLAQPLSKNLYAMSLGKYDPNACPSEGSSHLTGYQRPLIIASVIDKSDRVDADFIARGVASQLSSFGLSSVDYNCYSSREFSQLQQADEKKFGWFESSANMRKGLR